MGEKRKANRWPYITLLLGKVIKRPTCWQKSCASCCVCVCGNMSSLLNFWFLPTMKHLGCSVKIKISGFRVRQNLSASHSQSGVKPWSHRAVPQHLYKIHCEAISVRGAVEQKQAVLSQSLAAGMGSCVNVPHVWKWEEPKIGTHNHNTNLWRT